MSALAPWLLTRETALLLVGGFVVGIFSGHHWRWVLHFHPALAIPLPERLLRCHRREPQGRLLLPRHWLHDHEPEGDRLAGEPPLVCAARHWHGARCHGHRALAPALDAPGHHRGYRAFRVRSLASEARHEGLLPGRVARDRRLCWVPRRRHRHPPGRLPPSPSSGGRDNRERQTTRPHYRAHHRYRRHSALLPRQPHPRLVARLVGGELRGRARGRRSLGEAG